MSDDRAAYLDESFYVRCSHCGTSTIIEGHDAALAWRDRHHERHDRQAVVIVSPRTGSESRRPAD